MRYMDIDEFPTIKSTMNGDLTGIIKSEHFGKWLALSLDHTKIVDCDKDLQILDKRVDRAKVTFMKLPEPGIYPVHHYERLG